MNATPLTPAHAVWLVARREVTTRLRSKAFVIGTVVALVLIAAFAGFMLFIGQKDASTTVGMTGQATALAEPLREATKAFGENIEIRQVSDIDSGERQVREGDLDALVSGAPDAIKVLAKNEVDPNLRKALTELAQQQALQAQLAEAGLDPEEVQRTVAGAKVEASTLEPEDPQRLQRLLLGLGGTFLLYFGLLIYGQMVAQGVVEEKSSRVVELLLSTVRPWQLLAGKVIGIGLVGLAQLTIIACAGVGAAVAADALTLPSMVFGALLSSLLWFLLGFFLFATMMAATAALVSRQEELQSVLTPVTILIAAVFVVGINLLTRDPRDSTVEVLSLVPFFSPILMPARVALGVAPPWQTGLAVALNLAALAGLVWLAAKIYSNAVLRTGARVKLREALRGS